MKKRRGLPYLIFLVLLRYLCGCTTIHSHNERLKLATDPEGADVYLGEKLIGHTPGWIEVPRSKTATLRFIKKGYPTLTKTLGTSYRWGDSFFSNFIWLFYGAPIASVIDYLDGTAWDFDKVGLLKFDGRSEDVTLEPPALIAVAPPQNDYELLSNEAAEKLQAIAHKRYSSSRFEDFDSNHNLFTQYGYTNEFKTPEKYKDNLYEDLDITHLLESDVKREGQDVVIRSKLIDVFTEKEVRSQVDKIPVSSFKYANKNLFLESVNYLIGLIPNTITFDFSQPGATIYTSNGNTFNGVAETSLTATSILSSVGFKSLYTPKLSKGLTPVFKLIPIITSSYDQFNFSAAGNSNFTNSYNFAWATITAGFGPELGLDTSIGYVYLELAPAFSMNWITASSNGGQDTSSRGTSLELFAEVGYSIFASSRINLRLYSRFESIPTDIWSQTLTQIGAQSIPVSAVNRTSAGLSIGYYFPEDRTFLKRAFFPY
jgi:hypothetical protein